MALDFQTRLPNDSSNRGYALFLMMPFVQALSRVQEFLGVPVRRLSSKHVKIHTRPLPDLVDNWEQVSQVLNGTQYGRFLDDADYVK
jgi:hypothetical protein